MFNKVLDMRKDHN